MEGGGSEEKNETGEIKRRSEIVTKGEREGEEEKMWKCDETKSYGH